MKYQYLIIGGLLGAIITLILLIGGIKKRIERLEDQLGLMRVTYIYTTNGIAEIATGFTIEQASNLYEVLRKVQAEREQPKFTNSTSITISNASEKTITVTFPKPYEAKKAKP